MSPHRAFAAETVKPWTDDPARLAPDERRREIARILARGVLRLHRAAAIPPESADVALTETTESCLELSTGFRPHVTGG